MIVVEGFDASGKTTLANALSQALGYEVMHTGGPTKSIDHARLCLQRSYNRMALMRCVQDRITHVSEAVYGALRNPDRAALALHRIGDIKVARMVVYCRPDTESLMQAFMTSHVVLDHDTPEHMEYIRQQAMTLIGLYDVVMELVKLQTPRVFTYNRFVSGETDRIINIAIRSTR